jgi:hypothetical protein
MGNKEQRQRSATLTLQRNVQFLYEEQLARFELAALGCDRITRLDEDWRLLSANVNGNAGLISVPPIQAPLMARARTMLS